MIREDDNQFILILWCHVWSPRQFISLIRVTGLVYQLNVVVGQFHDVSIDSRANFLRLAIVLEVGVVGNYHDGVCGVPHEVSPVSEASNDSQELPVVNRVVLLRFIECLGVESQRPEERVATTVSSLQIRLV